MIRRRLSKRGARFIARFEGFSSVPYRDGGGIWTIGFGHTSGVGPGSRPITRAKGLRLLRRDAGDAAKAVRSLVRVKLSQNQFDALVSFVFNVGAANFATSTLLRLLNEGHYSQVPIQLDRWIRDAQGRVEQGLVSRRRAEGRLFISRR